MNLIRMKPFNLRKGLLLFLAILPALCLVFLIQKYSVNVPYWDQWANVGLSIEQIHQGQFSFQYLISQQNESRPLFPRLLFLALAFLTGWNVNYEVLVIFLIACLISINLFLLSKKTIGCSQNILLLITLLLNLLVFSAVQWENWLWGIQAIVFVPIACLTANILIALKKLDIRVKVITQILLCTVSTFSYANGMVCWVLSPFALLLTDSWTELKRQKWLIALWVLACVVNFWLYFRDYSKPPIDPSLAAALVHPLDGLIYFFSFLGSPLAVKSQLPSAENVTIAACVGVVLVFLFMLQLTYLAVFFQRDLLQRLGGWLLIQAYALISGLITTLGRVILGVEQSLSSRYTTFSIYLTIGLIASTAIIFNDIRIRRPFAGFAGAERWNDKEVLQIAVTSLATTLVVLHLFASYNSVQVMKTVNRDRLYTKTCLIFIRFVPDDCIQSSLFPSVIYVEGKAEIADQFNFFQPRLAKTPEIFQSDSGKKTNPDKFGVFDALVPSGDKSYTASGWARLRNEKRVADSVLLTYQTGERSVLFAIAPVKDARRDVAKRLRNNHYTKSGWTISFPASLLPQKEDKDFAIKAWAFNTHTGKAFRIAGTHSIQLPG